MKKIKISLLCCLLLFTLNHCALTADSALEDARFALDEGDYQEAIDAAQKAVDADSTSVEAYRLLGDAYFGLSGLNFLTLEKSIVDLQNSTDPDFSVIADALPDVSDVSSLLANLRTAITTLQSTPGIDGTSATSNTKLAETAYDLALMEVIEQYAVGVYGSNQKTGVLDVTLISQAQSDEALADSIAFDNEFILAGVSSTKDFISSIRQTYCMLKDLSGTSTDFTLAEYQALVGCQLDSTNFNPANIAGSGVATCSALNPDTQSTAVTDCYSTDTL